MLGELNWTALGVVIQALAFIGLALLIWANTQATRLSAQVADAMIAIEVSERLAQAGRRFEEARSNFEETKSNDDKEKMDYEWYYMGATVEMYLNRTDPIRKRIDSDPTLVVLGAMKVLATAFPASEAGKGFRKLEWESMGALAEEMGL